MKNPRVAVVTGAASGIGRAAALRLARAGTQVAAIDCAADALHQVAALEQNITAYVCDVSDLEAVEQTAVDIKNRFGEVDRLVCAAGICLAGRPDELPISDFRRVMDVNYLGTVRWVNAVLSSMRARRAGEIVIFSSIAGWLPTPNLPAYTASKFALVGFSECLAEDAGRDGIRVLCVCPPAVDTPMLATMVESGAVPQEALKFVKPLSPDAVIDDIEKTLPSKRIFLFPGPGTTAMWQLRRIAPGLMRQLFRRIYRM